MKKYIKYISAVAVVLAMTGCNKDYEQDHFIYEGSENPEHYSYRNPVWEPSLAGGTVFKAASNFVGFSQETQWAKGLDYPVPAIQSSDLMKWSSNQQAFKYPVFSINEAGETVTTPGTYPEWVSGRITNVSADFARTIAGANYWMIYESEADNAFGAASAAAAPGPYTDMGKFLSAEDLGVKTLTHPSFAITQQVNNYLGYTTENGSYIQGLTIRRGSAPTLKGAPEKVSGPEFQDIVIWRSNDGKFYLLGTVSNGSGTEIRYGISSKATGPYVDRNGVELTNGDSNGELLVSDASVYKNPCNPMRVFQAENGYFYVAYNATMAGNEVMPSGFKRQPLFINPVEADEDGWFTSVIKPEIGWTTPRFE